MTTVFTMCPICREIWEGCVLRPGNYRRCPACRRNIARKAAETRRNKSTMMICSDSGSCEGYCPCKKPFPKGTNFDSAPPFWDCRDCVPYVPATTTKPRPFRVGKGKAIMICPALDCKFRSTCKASMPHAKHRDCTDHHAACPSCIPVDGGKWVEPVEPPSEPLEFTVSDCGPFSLETVTVSIPKVSGMWENFPLFKKFRIPKGFAVEVPQ